MDAEIPRSQKMSDEVREELKRVMDMTPFTQEEIDDLRKNGKSLTSLIEELEKQDRTAA